MRQVISVLFIVLLVLATLIALFAPEYLVEFLETGAGILFLSFIAWLITNGRSDPIAVWPPPGALVDPKCPDKLLPDETRRR